MSLVSAVVGVPDALGSADDHHAMLLCFLFVRMRFIVISHSGVVFLLINDPYLLVPLSSLSVKVIAADALNKRLAFALAFNPNLDGFLWGGKDFMNRALK